MQNDSKLSYAVNKERMSKILPKFHARGIQYLTRLKSRWVLFMYSFVGGCKGKHTYVKKKSSPLQEIISLKLKSLFLLSNFNNCVYILANLI